MRYRLLIVAFALLPGCYGDPTLPTADEVPAEVASAEPGTPSEAPVVAERGGRPSSGDEPAQTRRIQELGAILTKLGPATPGSSPASRPGADSWRPAELEKLTELCEACCAAGGGPCAACLGEVADAELASDEIWSLMGLFLGVLRPRAAEGAATIGRRLLLDDVGAIRDRAFRVIVGSGAARRGQPDSDKRRATSVPIAPRVGEPVLVVVEQVSSCPHVVADAKGPDSSGRVDEVVCSMQPYG